MQHELYYLITAQKLKFPIKDFFSKCDQIRSFLQIWSSLLKKSLMGNFSFCACSVYTQFVRVPAQNLRKGFSNLPTEGIPQTTFSFYTAVFLL